MRAKLQRTITSLLPVDKRREGSCNNCGACCMLPYRCTFLKTDEDGKSHCSIYRVRPPNCRKFPRTESQLNHVSEACGYSFKKRTQESEAEATVITFWQRLRNHSLTE